MIESHPDNALEDLRLDQPYAEFQNHIKSYDLDSMEKKVCVSFVHAHYSNDARVTHPIIFLSVLYLIRRITVTHRG